MSGTGVAWIKPAGFDVAKQVWCNFDNGVTYIQIRKYGTVSFNRSYVEYENGFGDANGDYWLGNKYANILSLTRTFTSGFTLMKSSGFVMVYYYDFVVLDSSSNFALQYSSSSSSQYPLAKGQPFQAYDTGSACAFTLGNGWWFGSTCSSGSLNGQYPVDFGAFSGATTTRIGIYWFNAFCFIFIHLVRLIVKKIRILKLLVNILLRALLCTPNSRVYNNSISFCQSYDRK